MQNSLSYYIKTLRKDVQTAKMELIAVQYRGRARVYYESGVTLKFPVGQAHKSQKQWFGIVGTMQ